MHSPNRSGWLRRSALQAFLLVALPLSLPAQVRRPGPAPTNPRAATVSPQRRTSIIVGGGIVSLSDANATKASIPVASIGFRRQISPVWLSVGGTIDVGSTTVNGAFFPYEKRPVGDSVQFVQVDGHATMIAVRFNADALFPIDEDGKFRAGAGVNAGGYVMMPSTAGGKGAGTFVAPTFGAALIGAADLTPKFGLTASLGFARFLSFDRDKLRPSDPALQDAVFVTPFLTPPPAKKSFGGARLAVGITYRLGLKSKPKGTR